MKSGENLSTDISNDGTGFEAANGWESLMNNESEFMAAFAAHALQKAKARERIEQAQKHSEPEAPYKQQRKKDEQDLGHIGTSILDVRDKTTTGQAIRSEFNSWGVEDGNYEEILRQNDKDYLDDYEADLRERREKLPFGEVIGKYNDLFTFLGENITPNPNIEQRYQAINGQKEKLQFILNLPLADKIQLFCSDSFGYANYDNFMHRLQFQQDFINGTAKTWKREWDGGRGEYIDVQRPLDSSDANRNDILLGLNRASLKSAMIGTPEYGAYKMATDIIRDNELPMTPDFPKISGYLSGITDTNIGSWEEIIDEYKMITAKVARNNPNLDEKSLEHMAVRKAANIFANTTNYNVTDRSSNSPYVSSFHESVAWAQLGYGAQRQFRGMRQKIEGSDLHNIERFIGKSGYSQKRSSMEAERSRLVKSKRLINKSDHSDKPSDNAKQEFLNKENALEIKKQQEWQKKELDRIQHKYDKLISKTRSNERKTIYEQRRQEELQKVEQDVSERITYFKDRTISGLIADIDARIDLLSRKIEKRKSLAEKAIELHFGLNGEYGEWDDDLEYYCYTAISRYRGCIDWINDAPFGAIKRAHRRMVNGMSTDKIYELAISETIRKAVNNPDQADTATQQMFENIEDGSSAVSEISDIVHLASKLSKYSEELSYSELESMSKKSAQNLQWIEDALTVFPFSDVKQFIDKGANLFLVSKLNNIAKEFGYELDVDQLIKLSGKKIVNSYQYAGAEEVFASALRNFPLDEVITAMDANVDLRILNAAKSVLSTQGISDFPEILNRATELEQFAYGYNGNYEKFISLYRITVKSIGIEKTNKVLSRGIDLNIFNMTIGYFKDSVGNDFDKALDLSERINMALRKISDLDYRDTPISTTNETMSIEALRKSDANYTESQIISLYEHGVTADLYKNVFIKKVFIDPHDEPTIEERSNLDFNDKVKLLQRAIKSHHNTWSIKNAIQSFDDDMLYQLAKRNADVVHASYVKDSWRRDEKYSEFNTTENILRLATDNLDVDVFLRAADAGFSTDEIRLYPFLASGLLTKERNE